MTPSGNSLVALRSDGAASGLEGIDIEPRSAISAGVFPHCTEKAKSTFPGMPPHSP
jgi:hypothetical protein